MAEPFLLEIDDLRVQLGETRAVSGISLHVRAGEFYGIVGESGSGKSVTAKSVIGLLPKYADISGTVSFRGTDLTALPENELKHYRGARIGFVFQDALAALDPVYTIGYQLVETRKTASSDDTSTAEAEALQLLREVGIADPEQCMQSYPHQLSGGMRQRVVIAAALIGDPDLIIADEPTTALDVTIQRQVLMLLRKISERRGTAVILITHDLGVVAETCDRVGVLYGGVLVEEANVFDLFERPQHPYTRALLRSLPRLGTPGAFEAIPGNPVRVFEELAQCPFAPRCEFAIAGCLDGVPAERIVAGSRVRCIRADEELDQ